MDGKEVEEAQDIRIGTLALSPDGRRVAYAAKRDKQSALVVEGQEGPTYDDIELGSIVFSPDSKRIAFVAKVGGRYAMVVDGHSGAGYDEIRNDARNCRVEEDRGNILCNGFGTVIAHPSENAIRVIDFDVLHYLYMPAPTFSPDSKHVAYTAKNGKQWNVVVDGQVVAEFDFFGEPSAFAFSPDSKHVAITGRQDKRYVLVVDGQKMGQDYDEALGFSFSPDGKRLAYSARKGKQFFVVVDGQPGPEHDALYSAVAFTLDSKHVVYLAGKPKNKRVLVVDGQERPELSASQFIFGLSPEGIPVASDGTPKVPEAPQKRGGRSITRISPDGKHMAWLSGLPSTLFLDGQATGSYHVLNGSPSFSSDGVLEALVGRKESFRELGLYCLRYIPTP
ncbi:MAG: hypothetical protein ACLQG3_16595 [Terracidiphilus sp.]